jgi:hypothetical protein
MEQAAKLRILAKWYRDLAEKAGEPWIWEARLNRASELEHEADLLAAGRPDTLARGGRHPNRANRKRVIGSTAMDTIDL